MNSQAGQAALRKEFCEGWREVKEPDGHNSKDDRGVKYKEKKKRKGQPYESPRRVYPRHVCLGHPRGRQRRKLRKGDDAKEFFIFIFFIATFMIIATKKRKNSSYVFSTENKLSKD